LLGIAAVLVAAVLAGAIVLLVRSGGGRDAPETAPQGAVTESEARQMAEEIVEDAFPQFADIEPTFYRTQFQGRSFYRATYGQTRTVTDADGQQVELQEILSISVDEETGEVEVAISN
jgi:hypothetical protein